MSEEKDLLQEVEEVVENAVVDAAETLVEDVVEAIEGDTTEDEATEACCPAQEETEDAPAVSE